MNPRARVLYSVKNIVSKLQFRHSVLIRRAANAASTIIAQSRSSLQRFRMLGARRCVLGSEIAADQPKRGPRMYPGGRPLKVAWAGRFIALKALPVLLMAAALPSLKGKLVVHIAGDGPCRKQWQSMASRLGIAHYCIWHGWLSEEATLSMLDDSDVLAFTSLAEGTPATVMRALSLGLPTICLGHCGYGEVVDHTCGILIYPGSSRCIVDGFANALAALVAHPEEIGKLSRGAIEKACHCGWESVACTIREAYKLALTPPC
jgi:glycosyltransferase involved in cell wall biosynthesis